MSLQISDSLRDGLEQLGWVRESYYTDSSFATYRHIEYTIDEHCFWIELKLSTSYKMLTALYCEIIKHGEHGGCLFRGYLGTKEDLIVTMSMLYIFKDDSIVEKYFK